MSIHPFYVGCDISKTTIDIFDAATGAHSRIVNTAEAVSRFLAGYRGAAARFVFEATGAYGTVLRFCLAEAGLTGVQVNPLRSRRFAQSRGQNAKTDRIDAILLADMGMRYGLQPTAPFCAAREALKSLIIRRDQLVVQRAAEKKRLLQASQAELRQSHDKMIALLTAEIDAFEALIEQAIRADAAITHKVQLLQSVPGIGRATAIVLIAMLPELGALSPGRIAALAGLAPFNRDSGTMKGQRTIAGGRPRVRRALYMAALAATRTKTDLGKTYRRLKAKDKPSKVAIIAVARKISHITNAIIRDNRAYS